MTIKITCPHCTQRIEAPGEVIGTIVDCPICSGEIHVGRRHVSHEFFSGVGGLNFCCIHCQQALAISEIFAGNNATCPVCNKQMQIPERSTPNLGVYHYSPGERWKPESILRHLEPFASKAKRIYVKPDIPEWPLRYVSKCCQLPNASVIGMMVSSASLPGSESVVFSDTSLFIIRGSEPTRLDYHHAFSLPISTTSAERIDLGDIGFSILDGQGDSFIRLFCKLAASYPGKLRPIVTEPPKNRKPSAREVREEAERECQEAFRNTPDGRNQLIVKISIQSTLGTKSICGPSEMANAGGDAYCRVLKKYGITYSWSDRLD